MSDWALILWAGQPCWAGSLLTLLRLQSWGCVTMICLFHRHLPYSMSPWIASALNYLGRKGFPSGSLGQKSSWNARDAGDAGSIPGSGRSPGGGQGNPLQYSCLESPRDRGDGRATMHEFTKSWIQLKGLSTHSRIWEGNMKRKLQHGL